MRDPVAVRSEDGVFSVVLVEDLRASSLRLLRRDLIDCILNPVTRLVVLRCNGREVRRWTKLKWAITFVENVVDPSGYIFVVVGSREWGSNNAKG